MRVGSPQNVFPQRRDETIQARDETILGIDANVLKPLAATNMINEAPNWAKSARTGDVTCTIWTPSS
jgi:hypothetical protein